MEDLRDSILQLAAETSMIGMDPRALQQASTEEGPSTDVIAEWFRNGPPEQPEQLQQQCVPLDYHRDRAVLPSVFGVAEFARIGSCIDPSSHPSCVGHAGKGHSLLHNLVSHLQDLPSLWTE